MLKLRIISLILIAVFLSSCFFFYPSPRSSFEPSLEEILRRIRNTQDRNSQDVVTMFKQLTRDIPRESEAGFYIQAITELMESKDPYVKAQGLRTVAYLPPSIRDPLMPKVMEEMKKIITLLPAADIPSMRGDRNNVLESLTNLARFMPSPDEEVQNLFQGLLIHYEGSLIYGDDIIFALSGLTNLILRYKELGIGSMTNLIPLIYHWVRPSPGTITSAAIRALDKLKSEGEMFKYGPETKERLKEIIGNRAIFGKNILGNWFILKNDHNIDKDIYGWATAAGALIKWNQTRNSEADSILGRFIDDVNHIIDVRKNNPEEYWYLNPDLVLSANRLIWDIIRVEGMREKVITLATLRNQLIETMVNKFKDEESWPYTSQYIEAILQAVIEEKKELNGNATFIDDTVIDSELLDKIYRTEWKYKNGILSLLGQIGFKPREIVGLLESNIGKFSGFLDITSQKAIAEIIAARLPNLLPREK